MNKWNKCLFRVYQQKLKKIIKYSILFLIYNTTTSWIYWNTFFGWLSLRNTIGKCYRVSSVIKNFATCSILTLTSLGRAFRRFWRLWCILWGCRQIWIEIKHLRSCRLNDNLLFCCLRPSSHLSKNLWFVTNNYRLRWCRFFIIRCCRYMTLKL